MTTKEGTIAPVRFDNFNVLTAEPRDLYRIGSPDGSVENGTLSRMATAWEFPLATEPSERNLFDFFQTIGADPVMQNNLPVVQERLGSNASAYGIAARLIEESGVQVPVVGSYASPKSVSEEPNDGRVSLSEGTPRDEESVQAATEKVYAALGALQLNAGDAVVFQDGIRNWTQRRLKLVNELVRRAGANLVVTTSNERKMSTAEGPDVQDGMTSASYMQQIVVPSIETVDSLTTLRSQNVEGRYADGDAVARRAASFLARAIDLNTAKVVVASNAGAWVQSGGQIRRALQEQHPDFDADGSQLIVATDAFALDHEGGKPKETHQNPMTALRVVPASAMELLRQIERRA